VKETKTKKNENTLPQPIDANNPFAMMSSTEAADGEDGINPFDDSQLFGADTNNKTTTAADDNFFGDNNDDLFA